MSHQIAARGVTMENVCHFWAIAFLRNASKHLSHEMLMNLIRQIVINLKIYLVSFYRIFEHYLFH